MPGYIIDQVADHTSRMEPIILPLVAPTCHVLRQHASRLLNQLSQHHTLHQAALIAACRFGVWPSNYQPTEQVREARRRIGMGLEYSQDDL
jgi:hypothetical protein